MIRRLWQLFAMGHTFGHACGVRVQKVQKVQRVVVAASPQVL